MENILGKFKWGWNCGSANDIDVGYSWNNGLLTLERFWLRRIIFKWRFCTALDGWIEESRSFDLPQPTSEPYTFPIYVGFVRTIGKDPQNANQYWGKRYKVEAWLYVITGKDDILDEEYHDLITGCFRRDDEYFDPDLQNGCIPPNPPCEETFGPCL